MHALQRLRERYSENFNEFDLIMIWILIKCGLAKTVKPQKNKLGEIIKNREIYHLRYGKMLIEVIMTKDLEFVTFMPVGKRVSHKKHYKSRTSKDHIYKMKRLNKRLEYE